MNRTITGISAALGTAALLVLAALAPPPVAAADNGAPKWKVWSYNPSNRALRGSVPASAPAGAVATFMFPVTPDTALLVTDHGSFKGTLLGDLTGKTVSAKVSASGGPFTYFGQGTPDNPCPGTATARLFFQTRSSGSFAETDYWWSNPASAPLNPPPNQAPISSALTGDLWSDFNGHFGVGPYATAFAAAVQNVTSIGVSFGGGCFFENGVGAPTGGSFTLNSFSVN